MNRIQTFFLLLFSLIASIQVSAETKEQQLKVMLRGIGHEFLMQLNDDTSLVLPIEKVGDRYALKFGRSFSFEPDNLFLSTYKVMEEFEIIDQYIVEVEPCDTSIVIHSFEANLLKDKESIACKMRALPIACYVFYFTLVENSTSHATTEENNSVWWMVPIGVVGMTLLLVWWRKRKRLQADNHLITIGQFQFDQKGMKLNLKAQSIELSSKETDLLYLLYTNENETLEREYILKVVWGDEGDYVGRTLDVFISKLRKKLEADSSIKIINVRGVGYRMVVG